MTERKCAPLATVIRPRRFATPRPPARRASLSIARLCEFEPPPACPLAQALRTAGTDVIDENSGPGPPAQSLAASSAGHQQLAPTRDALDQAVNSSHELPVFRRREELAMYLDKMSQVHSAAAGAGSPDSIRPDDLPPSSGIVSTGQKRRDHPSRPDGFRLTSVAVVVLRSARSPLMSSQRLDEIAQAFLARRYDPDASAVADAIVREALAFGQTAPAREEPPAGAP